MACQAGHCDAACYLCPLTERPQRDARATTELHCLDRFIEDKMEDIAQRLLEWGANIDARDNDLGLTPLGCILNRNGLRCMQGIQALLKNGANPLLKDDKGVDAITLATMNFSIKQVTTALQYVSGERLHDVKADALWFLLEMEYCEALIRGGQNYLNNLREILAFLVDDEVCANFERKTH